MLNIKRKIFYVHLYKALSAATNVHFALYRMVGPYRFPIPEQIVSKVKLALFHERFHLQTT